MVWDVVNKIERPASRKVIADNFDCDNVVVLSSDDIDISVSSQPSRNGNEQSTTESPNNTKIGKHNRNESVTKLKHTAKVMIQK